MPHKKDVMNLYNSHGNHLPQPRIKALRVLQGKDFNIKIPRFSSGKIAVALSGGVDSLVAAWLLKQAEHDVMGIHFLTGYEKKNLDIKPIAHQLNIPVYTVDLRDAFERDVVSYFIKSHRMGKTPNPCMICNKKIKFGVLYDAAAKLGADMLATGHYAGVRYGSDGKPYLIKARDPLKDQSYFLAMLSRKQLEHALFPLADFTKQEVLAIAKRNGLHPLEKVESQDICFVHGRSFADFMESKGEAFPEGEIVNLENEVIGIHRGL
ncbi:MAG: tRNA-specific 2-thiouridylase, partial [Desulfamplus sp.]|nr:tRNA-specific 2-thiouridylase [Desulfamplus sp.]